MNEYPEIQGGTRFGDTNSRQWRKLIEEHKAMHRVVFGSDDSQATASGIRSNARGLPALQRQAGKTIVIIKRPVEGDRTLLVREAKYVDTPPEPCTGEGTTAECFYEWHGLEFEVYPPLGRKPAEFAGDETTDSVDVPPKFATKYHRCRREHDVWMLEVAAAGGGGVSYCVVREVYGGGSVLVDVQFVRMDRGQWVLSGDVVEVYAKPGLLSSNYDAWVWQGPIHQTQTRYLPVFGKVLGFELDMDVQFLPPSARMTDCRPFTRATGT